MVWRFIYKHLNAPREQYTMLHNSKSHLPHEAYDLRSIRTRYGYPYRTAMAVPPTMVLNNKVPPVMIPCSKNPIPPPCGSFRGFSCVAWDSLDTMEALCCFPSCKSAVKCSEIGERAGLAYSGRGIENISGVNRGCTSAFRLLIDSVPRDAVLGGTEPSSSSIGM